MDNVFNSKTFECIANTSNFDNFQNKIRLLAVFGVNGDEVIFATNEDHVYGFGRNRFGGLGLSTTEANISSDIRFNDMLSGRQIQDFVWGYEHWIALTATGRCYSWGHNNRGQLGTPALEPTTTPTLINILFNQTVVQISCGGFHSLALTNDGKV